jgi:hypothetical protein
MPKGDRTGPMGMGSMTGRAAGYCAGYEMPGYANPISGRGFGAGFNRGRGGGISGFGGGRGRRNMFYATGLPGYIRFGGAGAPIVNLSINPEAAKQELINRAEYMQKELEAIRKRIDEIEKESDNK